MRIACPGRWAVALLIGTFAMARADVPTAPPADRAAIAATWTELDAAWAARDVGRITRLFTEDAILAFLPGERRLEGRPAIRAHFATQFAGQAPELRHVTEVRQIQPLASGLAFVDAQVRVLRTHEDGDAAPDVLRTFNVFAVMAAEAPERWGIRSVRAHLLPAGDEQPPGGSPAASVVARKNPAGVAAPVGAYSHVAVAKGGAELIVLAGQVGLSPEGELPPTVEEQCANALANVRRLLESEGIGPENVVKANIWLAAPIDRARFSELWGEFIDGHPPPTMLAHVARLARPEYLVEVEVWAVR
jgi:uncharacterized protein (TIGR02246 family)